MPGPRDLGWLPGRAFPAFTWPIGLAVPLLLRDNAYSAPCILAAFRPGKLPQPGRHHRYFVGCASRINSYPSRGRRAVIKLPSRTPLFALLTQLLDLAICLHSSTSRRKASLSRHPCPESRVGSRTSRRTSPFATILGRSSPLLSSETTDI